MEEACSTAWGKARLCSETRRRHDAMLTGPSLQLFMPMWKVACLMCSDGGREASHSHRSATVRPGTARFLTRAPLVDILTSSTCFMMESPSRSVLQSGGTVCCCIRWRGEGRGSLALLCSRGAALACCCVGPLRERRGSVAVLCWRGAALPCFDGAFLLLWEGEGRRGGKGGGVKAGVTGSRSVLSARAV